ncbi:DsbA family protein [Granulicella tundricola]|uniref:DsbA family protein n=1 Tax=Granulicella tundricola TaxID=940615 RepID=UPI0002E6426A|nr:thioredoxin domain-containing protein [Granulicella tundricola]
MSLLLLLLVLFPLTTTTTNAQSTPIAATSTFNQSGTFAPLPNPAAPATLIVFSDFACPFSARTFFTLQKLSTRYPNSLHILYKQTPLPIHPDAPLAARAALAAARQNRYNAMAELLFANQTHQDLPTFLSFARQLHLDIPRFRRDYDSPAVAAQLATDLEESHAFGVIETPTSFLNGKLLSGLQDEPTLTALIDKASTTPSIAPTLASGNDGTITDPTLLAQILAPTSPTQGPATAPLTIVEFTDFQCPFCRAAVAPMEQLMAARGQEVRWIFRAFPLDFHQFAEQSAEAALAAGEQGKFWPMHDLLFAHQSALTLADLHTYAQQLNLNLPAFDEAMSTHRLAGQVAADRALGLRAGVSGTPTFMVDGHLMVGARSLTELAALADAHRNFAGIQNASARVPTAPAATHQVLGPEPSSGQPDTPITLTWFTDVRSPLAAHQAELLRTLTAHYEGRIRVLFKADPLVTHPDSRLASAALFAALALGGSDKFWPMFDALADRRDLLDRPKLLTIAAAMHLNASAFEKSLDQSENDVTADQQEATRRGISGAPVLFLNTERVDGLQREAFYTAILDRQLKDQLKAQPTTTQATLLTTNPTHH